MICFFALFLTLFLPAFGAVQAQDTESDAQETSEEVEEPAGEVSEVVIVSASRVEQRLHEVPAAFTVVTGEDLENAPADDYGDILRNVPGLSVTQISARDVQISSRQATNSLANDQLVMLDGRTLYLDFFGFVMWDLLPVNTREVKQIEVVRGPGSAVWGANAMSGVVNLITKSPKEMQGTSLMLGGGELGTTYGNLTHAGASEKLGYKVSLGYYEQDAYERPSGLIPNGTGTPYPPFQNSGTEQPKFDLRIDYDSSLDTTWSFNAGYAATDGIMHTGIGPFDIDSGSNMTFFKASWRKRAMQANFFVNLLDGDAANLLTVGADGNPLGLGFQTETYNLDFTNSTLLGDSHLITYGLTARRNDFDLTIAPNSEQRDEYGLFIQDEILIGDKVRWLIGARVDNNDPIDTVVSPRTSLLYSPSTNHTFRASYNEAFRAPSVINNWLDITIFNQAFVDPNLIFQGLVAAGQVPPGVPCEFVLTTCTPFLYTFGSLAVGNPGLVEESLESYEVGYVGTFGSNNVSLSIYRSELTDSIDFYTAQNYDSANPPFGWPVQLLAAPIPVVPPGTFPSVFSYRNIGESTNEGVEFSISGRPTMEWSWNFNYTYQSNPEVTGIDPSEVNVPAENRFNVGLAYDGPKFFANANVNYQDDAFWTDILDARFHGPTDDFTMVNLAFGFRFNNDKIQFRVVGNNIFDDEIQQHVFGDILERKVTAEIRFDW